MTTENAKRISIAEAIRDALREEMQRDESVFLMGQDVGTTPGGWGGPFTTCKGLVEEFGRERVRNAPISEKAIVGASVGAAMLGMRPVCEIQYSDFIFCCMDELINIAAKMRSMSAGAYSVPMVFRAPTGASQRGAQHAQSPEAFMMHVPGVKVVCPATPYDAKGLLKSAIRDDSPVMFFEHKLLYGGMGGHRKDAVNPVFDRDIPDGELLIPIGKADVKRPGGDVTLVTLLRTVHMGLTAAARLAEEGVDVEVLDLRSLLPLDREAILASVAKTGRLVIAEEDTRTLGWGAEVAATVAEEAFPHLKKPIRRVATMDVPIPFAPHLEAHVLPNEDKIIKAIKDIL